MLNTVDYGPLKNLIGTWIGDKGVDLSPEPNGTETSPYYETICYTACEDVENAESEVLSFLHYRQIVKRKSNDKIFHDQTGYLMWNPATKVIMHSFSIPRGVTVLAGGLYIEKDSNEDEIKIELSSKLDDKDWGILQSPFMQKNAKTTAFVQKLNLSENKLSYSQTTSLEIYGRSFEHTETNELMRK